MFSTISSIASFSLTCSLIVSFQVRNIEDSLWRRFSPYLFENVYFTAATAETRPMFNTIIDIKLREWKEKNLEQMCLTVGSDAMKLEMRDILEKTASKGEQDPIYDTVKKAAVEMALDKHKWERQAVDRLRTLVTNALDDNSVASSLIWDHAVEFWQTALSEKLAELKGDLREEAGPSFTEKWAMWKSAKPEQKVASEALVELEKLQKSIGDRKAPFLFELSADDLNAVKKNLQLKKIVVEPEMVQHLWSLLRRQSFLRDSMKRADACRNSFYYFKKGSLDEEMNCDDVLLFSRVRRMISQTSRSLAQQIDESEIRRFERELKRAVNEIGQDKEGLRTYFAGKRVELAEKLKQVRQIQEKLDLFVATLSDEEKTKRAKLGFAV